VAIGGLVGLLALTLSGAGCRSGEVESRGTSGLAAAAPGNPPAGSAGAAVAPAANADAQQAARPRPIAPLAPEPWHVPVGITLLIEPGKGLGPIRFGARLETIERLMAEPCEQKRQDSEHVLVCRYSAQAVEFFLSDGALSSVHVHRLGRPFGTEPKPDFGIFNGRFEGGAALGMLMSGVQELLGKPKAVHPVKQANPYGTIERHEYNGFALEYDRLDADRVVLGGIVLTAPGQGGKPSSSKSTKRR
jgi:hypothetical protein